MYVVGSVPKINVSYFFADHHGFELFHNFIKLVIVHRMVQLWLACWCRGMKLVRKVEKIRLAALVRPIYIIASSHENLHTNTNSGYAEKLIWYDKYWKCSRGPPFLEMQQAPV